MALAAGFAGSGLLRLTALALTAWPAAGVTGRGRMVDDILAAEPPQSPHEGGHAAGPAPLLELGSNESVHRRPPPTVFALGARGNFQQLGARQAAARKRSDVDKIKLYHWSPHYQCFVFDKNDCKQKAKDQLTKDLKDNDPDFAHVIEMTDFTPPEGYKVVQSETCESKDGLFVLYKEDRWTASGDVTNGCMSKNAQGQPDRAFMVTSFKSVGEEPGDIVVVGAHFPHPVPEGTCSAWGMDKLGDAIKKATESTKKVIFMGDTNLDKGCSSKEIAKAISIPNAQTALCSQLYDSCCWEKDKESNNYAFGKYQCDRVVANFGKSLDDPKVLYKDPVPEWAGDEMHAGLVVTLTLGNGGAGSGSGSGGAVSGSTGAGGGAKGGSKSESDVRK